MITRTRVNDLGVWSMEFIRNGEVIGEMFRTYHPTIPYEVTAYGTHVRSHRVHSDQEAIKWLEGFFA